MNGYLIPRSHTLFRIVAVIFLAPLLVANLEARDLVWQPHPAAGRQEQPRKFADPEAKRLADVARSLRTESVVNDASGPAIVALQSDDAEEQSLEPIPVANYRQINGGKERSASQNIQASYGPQVHPQVYPHRNYSPANAAIVEPWHPDVLYASSGAGLKVAHRADVSVLTPKAGSPEAVTTEIAGPEEILPEDLGPGEILIPDNTNPLEVGTLSNGCCTDCGGSPCECDPDWGYPLPCCGLPCFPFLRPTLEFVDLSVGAESFSTPADQGVNSNFGFNESINLAGSWLGGWVGWQVGARFIQADLHGMRVLANGNVNSAATFRPDDRHQEFLTLGLFHRATEYQPWQGGVAIDFMEDHFYYKTDLSQLRLELSRRFWCRLDFGTWIVLHTDKEELVLEERSARNTRATYEASDQYTLFIQWAFPNGGEARLYGGGGDNRDGIIGGNFWAPLSHSIAVDGNFGYLFSGKTGTILGISKRSLYDSYGVSLNISWYPHCRARVASRSPYRPLFPIANNGTFFVNRRGSY